MALGDSIVRLADDDVHEQRHTGVLRLAGGGSPTSDQVWRTLVEGRPGDGEDDCPPYLAWLDGDGDWADVASDDPGVVAEKLS
jgi:hypothetical protein